MNHDLPARKVYVIFNVDFRSFVNKNCLKLDFGEQNAGSPGL